MATVRKVSLVFGLIDVTNKQKNVKFVTEVGQIYIYHKHKINIPYT